MSNEINKDLLEEIKNGIESDRIEFKEAQGKDGMGSIPKSVYETVCSFSNSYGGNIYLGVGDNGEILGIEKKRLNQMKKDFVTSIQSSNKINPPLYLSVNELKIQNKYILHIYVPDSSQVHRLNQRVIFDRNEDADIGVTNNTNLVQKIYNRKQSDYTENKIYPFIETSDFNSDLIDKVRENLVNNTTRENILEHKSDFEVLKSLSMYKKDYTTGKSGFTAASVLLFGSDELIKSIFPYFYIDVLVRMKNVERYDDRLRIQTNLIDSYSKVMEFFSKYISEPFYLEDDIRINLREILLREVLVNLLVHREYSNPFVSTIEIRNNEIILYNANKPVHPGMIISGDILPFSKNPNIARVFHVLGLVDEIGSGLKKVFKYAPILFGSIPIIENKEFFKVIMPITSKGLSNLSISKEYNGSTNNIDEFDLNSEETEILKVLTRPMSARELVKFSRRPSTDSFRRNVLLPLLNKNLIERTIPNKPSSPKQKYRRKE